MRELTKPTGLPALQGPLTRLALDWGLGTWIWGVHPPPRRLRVVSCTYTVQAMRYLPKPAFLTGVWNAGTCSAPDRIPGQGVSEELPWWVAFHALSQLVAGGFSASWGSPLGEGLWFPPDFALGASPLVTLLSFHCNKSQP